MAGASGAFPRRHPSWPALAAALAVASTGCASGNAAAERRTGLRTFPNGQLLLPAPRALAGGAESYGVGPGDVLAVRVFNLEKARELSTFDVAVDGKGSIDVPFAGSLPVGGKTIDEVRSAIATALASSYLVNPQVTVIVKEFRSRPVTVTGAVERGGVFYLQRNDITLVEALSLAGGLSTRAGTTAVVLTPARNGSPATRVDCDLVALLLDGDARFDVPIEAHATVNVLPADDFYVVGYVPRPGSFPFHRPLTVMQAVGLAGGVDERVGSPSAVVITRTTERGVETLDVDLTEISAGASPDVAVLPGDTIQVGRTFGKWAMTMFETLLGRIGIGAYRNI